MPTFTKRLQEHRVWNLFGLGLPLQLHLVGFRLRSRVASLGHLVPVWVPPEP